MGWSGKLTRCAWQLLIAVGFALGCGHAERSGNQQPGTPPMSCVVDDAVYSHGYVISSDACRTCTCLDGSVVCKDVCGPRDCVIEGTTYKPGERFVDRDGCYDCTCQADGSLNCTLVGCRTCGSVERDLAVALREAESCDPLNNDCSELVVTKLGCSCQGLVNTANSAALEKMRALEQEYADLGCAETDVCSSTCATPLDAYCSEGRCQTLFDTGQGKGCKVSGVAYADGATGIKDPTSCNLCECQNGQLVCTEEDCYEPCEIGTVYAEACVTCGDLGDCGLTERACFPGCDLSCPVSACSSGACSYGLNCL